MASSVLSERADGLANGHQPNVFANAPLSAEEFALLLAPLAPAAAALAVAVSGGGDSMALALLTAEWAKAREIPVAAVTVDHGLRTESAAEAAQVQAWLTAAGIEHTILRWEGDKPATGLHAAARAARYRLLGAWCRTQGIGDLVLAHHRDDQSETMLMRLARSSGASGLAAMAAVSERGGLRLLRPLLGVAKARLLATLAARGQAWIEDPSNANPRFGRTRVRHALRDWNGAATHLATQAYSFGVARQHEEAATAATLQAAQVDSLGVCRLPRGAATAGALAHVLCIIGGHDYAPEREALQRLADWIARGPGGQRSLHRCVLTASNGAVAVRRELRELPRVGVPVGQEVPWDGRYAVRLDRGEGSVRYEVGPVPADAWPHLKRNYSGVADRAAALSLPALFGDGRLLTVPQLGLLAPSSTLRVSPLPGRTLAFRPFAVVSSPG